MAGNETLSARNRNAAHEYVRCNTSEAERRGELDGWLHHCNQHRPHTPCGATRPSPD